MRSHLTRFWPIPEAATKDPRLNRSCLSVLAFMTSYWNTTGRCFPLVETIQARCSMSRRTVFRCLAALEESGWIKRNSRGKQVSTDYLPGPSFTQNEVVPTLTPGAKNGTRSRSTTRSARVSDQVEQDCFGIPPFTDEFYDYDDRRKTFGPT